MAQQLSEGNDEIGRIRHEYEDFAVPSEENGASRDFAAGQSSQNFSGNLFERLSRRPSHREGEQELQEVKRENGEASFLKDAKDQETRLQDGFGSRSHQLNGFGSQNLTGSRRPSIVRGEEASFALVIDGYSLAFVLVENDLQEEFIRLCKQCTSILCCRVSPRQKAQVTKLVRKGMGENRLCLAIGDGANDVGMIQAANVGVGIIGVEGAQVSFCYSEALSG